MHACMEFVGAWLWIVVVDCAFMDACRGLTHAMFVDTKTPRSLSPASRFY